MERRERSSARSNKMPWIRRARFGRTRDFYWFALFRKNSLLLILFKHLHLRFADQGVAFADAALEHHDRTHLSHTVDRDVKCVSGTNCREQFFTRKLGIFH